jgi:hypothetical protein
LSGHAGRNPSAGAEIRDNFHPSGLKNRHKVIQDPVCHVLIKDALIAVCLKVKLQTF